MNQLSIIVPCYNESEGIASTTSQISSFVRENFPNLMFELILIDDGSTDATANILEEIAKENPAVHPIYFPFNKGRGAAIKAGISRSTGTYLIMLDADLSYDIQHIKEILLAFETDPKVDVVVVSPYMRGGVVRDVPWRRYLFSRIANWILSGFFAVPLSTVTCVVRGYRGDLLRPLPLFEEGKGLHLEILRKLILSGANFVEIPGRLIWKNKRKTPRRKANIQVVQSAKQHLLYALLTKPTRLFKYTSFLFLGIGIYEVGTIAFHVTEYFSAENPSFWYNLWKALSKSYARSPHTFIISGVALILGFQHFSIYASHQILKLQHEETLKHILSLFRATSEQEHKQ